MISALTPVIRRIRNAPRGGTLLHHQSLPWLVVGLAVIVRFWCLDFHSFWFDEAVSLRWATSDVSFIWEKTFPLIEEKHPPAYYILLHGWLRLLERVDLQHNDAAIRALGAGLGVLGTWSALRLAQRLSGWYTGLLTGMFIALSPLLVWYSQETRMFLPATTGILLGALALHAAWHSRQRGKRLVWWLLMVVGLTFALYSYLFSAFVMPSAGLTLLLLQLRAPDRRRFLEGVAALAIVTLLYLPLANNALLINAAESTPGRAFENFWANHLRLLQIFTVWRVDWPTWLLSGVLLAWGATLLAGLWPIKTSAATKGASKESASPRDPANLDAYWLWLWVGLPLLIANFLLSRSGSIFNEDRYLLFLAPFTLWAVARGVLVVARRLPLAAALLAVGLLLTQTLALPQVWSVARFRENWRAAAAYIVDYTRAAPQLTGAVVSHIEYTNLPLQWYLRQALSHEDMPVFFPFGGWIDPQRIEEDVAPPLRGIEELGVDTLWLVQAHTQHVDPDRLVESWLQATYPIVTELHPAGIKLTGHILRDAYPALPVSTASPPVEVAPGLWLHHCAPLFAPVTAVDVLYHPPSGWVHLQSWWSVAATLPAGDYTLAARVVAPGAIWGTSLVRESDTFIHSPPPTWTPGDFVRVETDINLNPITPPGSYAVEFIVEHAGAEHVAPCGTVEIR